jgi:hypothetical protein
MPFVEFELNVADPSKSYPIAINPKHVAYARPASYRQGDRELVGTEIVFAHGEKQNVRGEFSEVLRKLAGA